VWSTSNVDEVPDAATTAKVNQRFLKSINDSFHEWHGKNRKSLRGIVI
jgi:hypothetical protein